MNAGQFVIFWSTLMHSSYPNVTKDKMRLGYASRYIPTSVRVYPIRIRSKSTADKISLNSMGRRGGGRRPLWPQQASSPRIPRGSNFAAVRLAGATPGLPARGRSVENDERRR